MELSSAIYLLRYKYVSIIRYRALGDYVEDQLIKHRKPEFSIIQPPQIRADPRVHLCLFFINAHQRQYLLYLVVNRNISFLSIM